MTFCVASIDNWYFISNISKCESNPIFQQCQAIVGLRQYLTWSPSPPPIIAATNKENFRTMFYWLGWWAGLGWAGWAGWAGGRVSVQMESDKLLPVTELASPGDPRCRSNTAPRGNINTENIIAVWWIIIININGSHQINWDERIVISMANKLCNIEQWSPTILPPPEALELNLGKTKCWYCHFIGNFPHVV